MMGKRQSGRHEQPGRQVQSGRQKQPGKQEQDRETRESIRVLGRVIRYMAANYKFAVTGVLA